MPCSGCPGFGPKVYLAVLLVANCVAVVTVVAVDGGGDVGGLGGDAPGVGTGVGSAAGLLLPSLLPPNFECKHIAGTTVSARFQTWSQISVANILIYLDPNYQTDVCHKLTPDRIFKLMGLVEQSLSTCHLVCPPSTCKRHIIPLPSSQIWLQVLQLSNTRKAKCQATSFWLSAGPTLPAKPNVTTQTHNTAKYGSPTPVQASSSFP